MAKRLDPPYGKHCDGCPLRSKAKFVGFESPQQAQLAIIGESPGRMELLDRRPFVGESGRLLNNVLEQLDVSRLGIFIGNVVQCRCVGLPDTKPTPPVTAQCGYITVNMMQKLGVKRVLTLGAFATEYFRGHAASIMKERGNIFQSRYGFEVYPTFHPAAILRRPDGATEFFRDIELFFYPERQVDYVPGSYTTITSLEQAIAILQSWEHLPYLVIDLETSGYMPHKDAIICASISPEPQLAFVFPHEIISTREFWAEIKRLNDNGMGWIMHGAFFDHRFIYAKTKIWLNVELDTMLSNYALDERGGVHDLKKIAAERFGFPDWEATIRQYLKRSTIDSYAKIPRDILYRYAAYDADATMRLAQAHYQQLSAAQMRFIDNILVPGTCTLGQMSLTGISIDSEHWQRLYDRYTMMVDSARDFMRRYVGDPEFNPNSVIQVRKWMYDEFGLPTHDKSAKLGHHPKLSSGRTSTLPPRTTAMDQLERLSEGYKDSIWIRALITFRTKRKAITSYLKGYAPDPKTGRIHPRYLVHGTRTGRLSSRDPNIMNAPHYGFVRELIVPQEGCILVSVDYSQAELRVLAALAHSEKMAQVYREGGDLHNIVSTEIFGKGYSKRERMIAKAIVFGLVYGRSISNIAETFGISLDKAHEYYELFLGRFDGVEEWMANQKRFALEHGYVELPVGHRRRFRLITRSNVAEVQRQAVNTPVQGTASYFMFISLIRLHEYIVQNGGHMLFPLHDSIMFELPLDNWKELALGIINTMEDVPKDYFGDFLPFAADCDVGWRWGRMFEFKKKNGVLRLDDESPGWWPEGETYDTSMPTLESWNVVPELEDWYERLDWGKMEWEAYEFSRSTQGKSTQAGQSLLMINE